MAYKEEIITQYNKFYEDYGNKHIDDYETFIRTRVIEYFFHLSQDSIDEITSFVNMVLDREKNNSPMSFDDDEKDRLQSDQGITTMHGKITGKKIIMFFLAFAVVVFPFIFRRKK